MEQEFEALIRRADLADREAADKLFAILYSELRRLAESNLRRAGSSLTLGTTTLLHEAYLNIAGRENIAFVDRPPDGRSSGQLDWSVTAARQLGDLDLHVTVAGGGPEAEYYQGRPHDKAVIVAGATWTF